MREKREVGWIQNAPAKEDRKRPGGFCPSDARKGFRSFIRAQGKISLQKEF